MSALSLGLILAAAFAHASWNLLVKRAGRGPLFLFLSAAISTVLWAPLALILAARSGTPVQTMVFAVAISGTFHLTYFLSLQAGYRVGDLSLVYPLARGTGPAISVVAAIVIRDERPPVLALIGAAVIVTGLFTLVRGHASARTAVLFGIGTGVVIAGYTLWDKHALSDLAVDAVVLSWGTEAMRAVMLAPLAVARRAELGRLARSNLSDAFGFAVLSPLAYILVLVALSKTDVAFVAPAREVSIVIGVILGRMVLGEVVDRRRVASAIAIAGGVVLLAVA